MRWNQTEVIEDPMDPDSIIEGCLEAHRNLLYGFGGNPRVDRNILEESLQPIHAAISLEGEPTLYPLLGELIEAFKDKGFKSVFIVTNGTEPKVLESLCVEPTQLYVSVCAPDEITYENTCRPMISGAWEKLLETIELLESFHCPTVLRHTLIPKWNMHSPEKYGRMAELGNVTYIEPKAAMSVGAARNRFGYNEMAWFNDVKNFAEEIALNCSYNIVDEHEFSNIILLSKLEKPIKLY
jgi:tRNA wybutosine-synthesizing protein 1